MTNSISSIPTLSSNPGWRKSTRRSSGRSATRRVSTISSTTSLSHPIALQDQHTHSWDANPFTHSPYPNCDLWPEVLPLVFPSQDIEGNPNHSWHPVVTALDQSGWLHSNLDYWPGPYVIQPSKVEPGISWNQLSAAHESYEEDDYLCFLPTNIMTSTSTVIESHSRGFAAHTAPIELGTSTIAHDQPRFNLLGFPSELQLPPILLRRSPEDQKPLRLPRLAELNLDLPPHYVQRNPTLNLMEIRGGPWSLSPAIDSCLESHDQLAELHYSGDDEENGLISSTRISISSVFSEDAVDEFSLSSSIAEDDQSEATGTHHLNKPFIRCTPFPASCDDLFSDWNESSNRSFGECSEQSSNSTNRCETQLSTTELQNDDDEKCSPPRPVFMNAIIGLNKRVISSGDNDSPTDHLFQRDYKKKRVM